MQEEGEDAAQTGAEVGLGLAAPHLPVGEDGAAAQVRADEITIDALVERCAGIVGKLLEAGQPCGGSAAAVFEGGLGEVVQAVVVAVDAQLRSGDGGVLEGLVEKGARERSALGH